MIAYFDCFSGMSGDMTLGALVDAGVPIEQLRDELARLPVEGYELTSRRVKRAGMRATKVDVHIKSKVRSQKSKVKSQKSEVRKWKDIQDIIAGSSLSAPVKQKGLRIFKRLFQAEARIHGARYDTVHLHELGAVDCIVDIFGSLIGLDILGIDTVYASPLNLGSGYITSEHGFLPVPAPASVELLKGIPVFSSGVTFELTTPTGAALISSLSSGFGPMPEMIISGTGTGAGDRNFRRQPNILRILLGECAGRPGAGDTEVSVVETNIDDMNPQVYDYVMERLFSAGALDVFLTRIMMKKNRPGTKLTVLTEVKKRNEMIDIILRETTSIGLRYYNARRKVLKREITSKKTRFGSVKVKVSKLDNGRTRMSAEYDDCKKIARKFNVPLIEVLKTVTGEK